MRRRWSWRWWNLWWSWNYTLKMMFLFPSPMPLLLLPFAADAVSPLPRATSSGSCRRAADSRSMNSAAHWSIYTSCRSDSSRRTAPWPDSAAAATDSDPGSWGRFWCLGSDAAGAASRKDAALDHPLEPNLIPHFVWVFRMFFVFIFVFWEWEYWQSAIAIGRQQKWQGVGSVWFWKEERKENDESKLSIC